MHQPFYREALRMLAWTHTFYTRRNQKEMAALLVPIRHPFFGTFAGPTPTPDYAQTAPAASIFLRR